jgi:anti-sigma-K factor RskA
MTTDAHTLVGPYVLDALTPDEQEQFEQHLRHCADCRADVEGLRATAGRLGRAAAVTPSPDLRDRVLQAAATTRQVAPGRPAERRRPRWLAPVAAAAAVLVVALSGAVALRAERRADRAEDLQAVLMDPAGHTVEVTGPGGEMRLVVSPTEGRSILVASGMSAPPSGHDYEVWFGDEDGMEPMEVFSPRDDGSVELQLDGLPPAIVGITVEPDGGSEQPTLPMVASGTV